MLNCTYITRADPSSDFVAAQAHVSRIFVPRSDHDGPVPLRRF
jgi:hypothetical protein